MRQDGEVVPGHLVLLVLEQPADELLARVGPLLAVRRIGRLVARKQHARLDVRQRRRHQEVLAGEVQVERARRLHVLDVLPGDEGDGNVQDVQLVLLDEREQEIERPLELRQREGEAGRPFRRGRRRSCRRRLGNLRFH